MARDKSTLTNIDASDLVNYPNARIKNNTGAGDGTPVNEFVYGDIHEAMAKLMRLYGLSYNGLPDNETNGYQLIEAMKALASKNDYLLSLGDAAGVLTVPLKLGKLKNEETFILKTSIDKAAQTTIRGTLDNVTKPVTFLGNFKINDYVRMINTATGVILVRMIDSFNLQTAIDEYGYLLKATQTEENAGAIDTKATTPLTNLNAFVRRVNGIDSENYLAKPTGDPQQRDGLLSHEDKKKIDDLADPSSLIKITSASSVAVNAPVGGHLNGNFNFNYVDIFPPAGKTMANLQGFMASNSEIAFNGNVDGNDEFWCQWRIEANKIRVIAGAAEIRTAPRINWMAIWI